MILQFLFKDKKQSSTYFVKWKNNIINYNSFREKKKKKIQYETKISFFVSKMKKWIKKLCTLKQNHYRSRKNECSFFKSIFRSRFHFFDWLRLIVHWYSVLCLIRLKVSGSPSVSCMSCSSRGSSAWTVVVQPPSFVSS